MSLRSPLFRGDPKLEAAAVSNPAHILPGAVGAHVAKIQQALIQFDGAAINPNELEAKLYGPSTANAVLSYKMKRNIINRSYQTQADNIVGIMTIAALDREMQTRIDPIVIIGRFVVTARPTAVNVTRFVIGGNPFVPTGANPPAGMPDSLPPTKTYAVQVLVEPPLGSTGQFIELSIINTSSDNGSATIFPIRITKSATVTVTGGAQTCRGMQVNYRSKRSSTASPSRRHQGASVCAPTPLMSKQLFSETLTLLPQSE